MRGIVYLLGDFPVVTTILTTARATVVVMACGCHNKEDTTKQSEIPLLVTAFTVAMRMW